MKIAQVPRRFVREAWGGTKPSSSRPAKRLITRGHQTEVLCPNALARTDEDVIDGVPVRRFPYFYPIGSRRRCARRPRQKGRQPLLVLPVPSARADGRPRSDSPPHRQTARGHWQDRGPAARASLRRVAPRRRARRAGRRSRHVDGPCGRRVRVGPVLGGWSARAGCWTMRARSSASVRRSAAPCS